MEPYRNLWWRIVGGCLLGLLAVVAAGSVLAWRMLAPWPLVERPAQSILTYQVEAARGVPADEQTVQRVIDILWRRIDPHGLGGLKWRVAGVGRMEVRMPAAGFLPATAPAGQTGEHQFTPEDLSRLVGMAGSLEFRIVTGYRGLPVDPNTQKSYEALLAKQGPESAPAADMPFAWFPIRGKDKKAFAGIIQAEHDGRPWVLLSTRPGDVMLPGEGWTVVDAYFGNSNIGSPAIDFKLDQAGAKRFFDLTSSHKGQAMAILLDGEVVSAPTIQSAISDRGQITGKFTPQEVLEYVRVLGAGEVPARVSGRALLIQRVSGGEPPQANTKRALLVVLGVMAVGGLLMALLAVVRARVETFGRWAIVAAGSAAGWWYVAAWNSFLPTDWPLWAGVALGIPLVPLVVVWISALRAARRR